jgi:ethanolamine ammonia-lyase large subunit/ethanolamine ammonia-lyase small subunit
MTRAPAAPPLKSLAALTQARVALGRAGAGQPTRAAQAFALDHARAREAVWSAMECDTLERALPDVRTIRLHSAAADRAEYLRRPDLGRRLGPDAAAALAGAGGADVAIVVADGLSATAVNLNAAPVVRALLARLAQTRLTAGPVILAEQARVALGDAAATVVVLIGERPGLSSADSLGAYVTWAPAPGTPDSRRNCVSNIRDGGLPPDAAAEQIAALLSDMRRTGQSGVALKDLVARAPEIE